MLHIQQRYADSLLSGPLGSSGAYGPHVVLPAHLSVQYRHAVRSWLQGYFRTDPLRCVVARSAAPTTTHDPCIQQPEQAVLADHLGDLLHVSSQMVLLLWVELQLLG